MESSAGIKPTFDLRMVSPGSPEFHSALRLILAAPGLGDAGGPRPEEFFDDCRKRGIEVGLLHAASDADGLAGAAVALISPGSAALMLMSTPVTERATLATEAALAATLRSAADCSITLSQVLLDPGGRSQVEIARSAGFSFLTTLIYLQARVSARRQPPVSKELTWVRYNSETDALFCDAVERTYENSLDCPELAGLRGMPDVLASHRAAGEFDPDLWWVAKRGDEPAGVLLLTKLPERRIYEIVYMGVVPTSRGTGVASALLDRAASATIGKHGTWLALAVDERNAPARRVYERAGFLEVARRSAWIATDAAAKTYAD